MGYTPVGGGGGGTSIGIIARKVVDIPASRILTLNSVPLEVIEAPGAGNAIIVHDVHVFSVGGTTPYGTVTTYALEYGSTSQSALRGDTPDWPDATGRVRWSNFLKNNEQIATSNVINQPLMMIATDEPDTGDHDLRVVIHYSIQRASGALGDFGPTAGFFNNPATQDLNMAGFSILNLENVQGPIGRKVVDVPAAAILTLNSAPVVILPSPGADSFYQIHEVIAIAGAGTSYTSVNDIDLIFTTSGDGALHNSPNWSFPDSGQRSESNFLGVDALNAISDAVDNGISLKMQTGNPEDGDYGVRIIVLYSIQRASGALGDFGPTAGFLSNPAGESLDMAGQDIEGVKEQSFGNSTDGLMRLVTKTFTFNAVADESTVLQSGVLPANYMFLGISARITQAFGTSNGLTGVRVTESEHGDFYSDIGPGTGTVGIADANLPNDPYILGSAGDLSINSLTGDFDANGQIVVTMHYLTFTPPPAP